MYIDLIGNLIRSLKINLNSASNFYILYFSFEFDF